jgi:hypothetical protein
MFRIRRVGIGVATLVVALGTTQLQSQIPGCSGVTPPTVLVQNGFLWKNGQHFDLRGLQIRGFVSALEVSNDNASYSAANPDSPDACDAWAVDAAAQQAYGDTELAAAATWGANVIRLQVSQPSLDPLRDVQSSPEVMEAIDANLGDLENVRGWDR